MLILKQPKNNALLSLASEYQKEFFSEEQIEFRKQADGKLSFQWYDLKQQGERERSHPAPVFFSWKEEKEEKKTADERKSYSYLLISQSEDFSSPLVYGTNKMSISVYNLKMGATYYWCVQKNGKQSEARKFSTKIEPPRMIRIDDVSNVRDLGGYETQDGRIRQGLIYRGSEMDFTMHLSPTGAEEMQRLGIRTVIDLRGEACGIIDHATCELFGMRRIHLTAEVYESLFRPSEQGELYTFFSAFAEDCNYPIYFHCRGGADRTGVYAFILGALLGMKREALLSEYECTALSIWGTRSRNYFRFVNFLSCFDALPGETDKDRAESFLRCHAGLSELQIQRILAIMIEKATECSHVSNEM